MGLGYVDHLPGQVGAYVVPSLLELLDTAGLAVGLIAADGTVRERNQRLTSSGALINGRECLHPQLLRLVKDNCSNDVRSVSIFCPRNGARPLAIRCSCVQDGSDWHGYLLVVLDLNDFPRPKQSVLRKLFGLTAREAHLASELGRGKTVEEIAEEAGVALSTARTQMKGVFAKTRTNRQAELAAILARTCVLPGTKSKIPIVSSTTLFGREGDA